MWKLVHHQIGPTSSTQSCLVPVSALYFAEEHHTSPRVIVYCPTRTELYAHFHFELGECAYHPPGAPHLCENRIFGMFHSDTPQNNKDVILQSRQDPNGVVRVVFGTVALGMGVNLKHRGLLPGEWQGRKER